MKVDKETFREGDVLTVSVDVTNTGQRPTKESVLLYSSDLVALLTPDNCRLRAFEKVELQPGQTSTVTLQLPANDLSFVNLDGQWVLEPGEFRLFIADQRVVVQCEK